MTPVVRYLFPALLMVFLSCMAPQTATAFDEPMLSISTGNITGVYYAAGSAVAKMHNKKRKEYNLRLLAEASEGSIANVQNVIDRTVAFGIAQSNALYFAQKGEQYWQGSPHPNLRAVFGLYTEDYTVIAAADADIKTLADLRGKTVNIGEQGSSDAMQAMGVFDHLGIDPTTDLNVVEKPTYEASELLQNNDIDAYFYTVGHPNLSVLEASSGERKITIVSPGQDIIDHFVALRSYLLPTEVPIDYYPDATNQEPIPTISVKAILFTCAETDEQVVYNMVKEVFTNLDLFKRQHPAFANLTPEKMTSKLIVPLHPGAERYFKEAGLLP
jgi:TRAP transporter TAXI family solute receptor